MACIVDAQAGQPRFLADGAPEGVKPSRREVLGEHAHGALRPGQRREQPRRFRPEPHGARYLAAIKVTAARQTS